MAITRRKLLRNATAVGVAPLALLQGCDLAYIPCYDPEMLGVGEQEMRKTLAYVSVSENDETRCDTCQFYRLGDEHCGECELLDGPVEKSGYCTSWTRML